MGGSYALLLPCRSKDIRAAAPSYGEIPDEATLKNLACPILYVYGDQDFWITKDEVKRLTPSSTTRARTSIAGRRRRTPGGGRWSSSPNI